MEKAYKVCPRCQGEYLPSVEVCLDCAVPLVLEGEAPSPRREAQSPVRWAATAATIAGAARGAPIVLEDEASVAPGEAGLVLPPGQGLVRVRDAELTWAVGLGRALAEAGVPHRLDPMASGEGRAARWAVFVREEDVPRAAEVDAEYTRGELPDLPEASSGQASASAEDRCPACGGSLPGDVEECPECGLVFGTAR